MRANLNQAPFPDELADLVLKTQYRPGWWIELRDDYDRGQGSKGLTLVVTTKTVDTYDPDQPIRVHHLFPVPPASFNRRSWQWWLFQQLLAVEQHEAMEFFVVDGERPYAPMHGPGNDPYLITVERTDVDRRTNFRGELQTD